MADRHPIWEAIDVLTGASFESAMNEFPEPPAEVKARRERCRDAEAKVDAFVAALAEAERERDEARAALERHKTDPDDSDPDGWIRRSALNHWCDRATRAEAALEEARRALGFYAEEGRWAKDCIAKIGKILNHDAKADRLRLLAVAEAAQWLVAELPDCDGEWISGSGGHRVHRSGSCGATAHWADEPYYYCDEHRPDPTRHDSEELPHACGLRALQAALRGEAKGEQ